MTAVRGGHVNSNAPAGTIPAGGILSYALDCYSRTPQAAGSVASDGKFGSSSLTPAAKS